MRVALALLLVAVLAGCGGEDAAPLPGATTRATLVDRDGDAQLERGPGEPLVDRRELGGGGRPVRTLATFAQITDAHVRDEESPARAPFLDRLGDPFNSTFRPQEALSAQVLAATVRAVDALHPDAVVVTGDLVDSAQANEYDAALAVLRGGRVDPDSGARGYDGVQDASDPDALYYRPDLDAPRHPGLLERAQRPFRSPGLRAPWYPLVGNHDLLVAGEVPPTPRIEEVATGDEAVWSLPPGLYPDASTDPVAAVDSVLAGGLPGRTERVAADPRRRHVTPDEALRRLGRPGARLDYVFRIAPGVRGIALDTVDRAGGSGGVVSAEQAAWLERELARGGRAVVFSHQPLAGSAGGSAALAVLDRSPAVLAAVAGHTHANSIRPRRSAGGGYWLVTTASLADFPQQARMFRLAATAGGGIALETYMVDHDGAGLAGVARELSFIDAQGGRPRGFAGGRGDRNARLYLDR